MGEVCAATDERRKTIKTPASFVQQLKANPDAETLRSLRVYLTTEPIDWLKSFRDCHGLAALSNVVLALEKERNQTDAVRECEEKKSASYSRAGILNGYASVKRNLAVSYNTTT